MKVFTHMPCELHKLTRSAASHAGRRGLTLLEVAVALIVLCVLIAIIFPTIQQARRDASLAQCLANLRQIDRGWQGYLAEHAESFPLAVNDHANFAKKRLLAKTVAAPQVFRCPADTRDAPGPGVTLSSYIMSVWLIGDRAIGQNDDWERELQAKLWHQSYNGQRVERPEMISPFKLGDITESPSRLVYGGDYTWLSTINFPPYGQASPEVRRVLDAVNYHGQQGKANAIYLDGSSGFLEFQSRAYLANSYTVTPFRELNGIACDFDHCAK